MKTYEKLKSEALTIEKAINRISWRFNNENVKVNESKIVINELDVKAVEFLVNWINQQKTQTVKENELFAKLYAYAFNNELNFYKDPKLANNKLNNVLKNETIDLYNNVHLSLNRIELTNYINSLNIDTTHPLLRSLEAEKTNIDLFKINNKEITSKILGTWTTKNVYKSLNNTISELINKYK